MKVDNRINQEEQNEEYINRLMAIPGETLIDYEQRSKVFDECTVTR